MSTKEQTTVDIQFEHLVASLRRRHIETGSLPPERQLAEELNINRHQLRKALLRLRETGELEQTRGRRPIVPATLPRFGEELLKVTNPLEVLEFRMVAEPGLARLASLRASPVEIARILELARTEQGADSGEVDMQFHFAVVRAAHNHLAEELYRTMRQVGYDARMRVARGGSGSCPKRIAQRDAEHLRVAEAIARRDPDAASTAMQAHLNSVYNQVNQLSTAGLTAG